MTFENMDSDSDPDEFKQVLLTDVEGDSGPEIMAEFTLQAKIMSFLHKYGQYVD
jgi:hypothetical protein